MPGAIERRREQLAVLAALAALWALLFAQAWQSTVLLDDWVQRAWYRDHALDLELVWRVARYNYLHGNPRIGDVFLLLVNGPRAVHLIATPVMQLGLLGAAFAVGFGRWPGLTYRDLARALVLQVLIWLASPIPGVVYFYRPFATNYLFAFAAMLCWFAPYRIALAGAPRGEPRRGSPWWSAPMLALGWLAGMGNEHTGPAAIAAVAACLVWAARRRRMRAWMIAGALGLAAGYAMLMLAPGQAERYAGRAARFDALGVIAGRGVAGAYDIVAGFLGEVQWAIALALAAALGFAAWRRRADGEPAARVAASGGEEQRSASGAQPAAVAGLVAAAGAIVATLFASPVAIERLLFAPAVLVAAALAVVVDPLLAERRPRIALTAVCAAVFAYHAARFVQVHAAAAAENRQRIAALAAAPRGSVATVAPYRTPRSRWFWGDDFRMAGVREQVARDVFDLARIDLDPRPTWAEPAPPEAFVARWTYEPPLPPGAAAPSARTPRFLDAALDQLRRALALGAWSVAGHRLIGYDIDAEVPGFVDPSPAGSMRRPVRVVRWTPAGASYVYGDGDEVDGQPVIRVAGATLPAGWTDTYVVGCGRTARVEPRRAGGDLIAPIALACRGSYAAVVCEPDACWFAGRYWR